MAEPQSDYERAFRDGQVAERLNHHAEQIKATNLVLAKTVDIAQSLTSTVQTLTEARVTDAATRVATAQAVKDAKDQQETQATKAWSPLAKFLSVLGAAVTVIAVLWAVLSSLPTRL